jgi:hypothetical protein
VYVRWVTFAPRSDAAYVGPEVLVRATPLLQTGSAVALLRNSFLVALREQHPTVLTHAARLLSLDQFGCGTCEGFANLETKSPRDKLRVAAAATSLRALLVWESVDTSTGQGEIRARAFLEAVGPGGSLPDTACGPDVAVYATCGLSWPTGWNQGFHLRLEQAEPGRAAFLLLREAHPFGAYYMSCGSGCSFLDPFRSWCFPVGITDSQGDLAVPLPIPPDFSLSSASFQFGLLPSAAPGCPAVGLSFSRVGILAVN